MFPPGLNPPEHVNALVAYHATKANGRNPQAPNGADGNAQSLGHLLGCEEFVHALGVVSGGGTMTCPTCNKQMKKLADSKEMMGLPPTPKSTDYECATCGQKWRFDRENNSLAKV